MTANPFIAFWHDPVVVLTLTAYLLVLLALLVLTWYALGRNLMTMHIRWQQEAWSNGTPYPPFNWTLRAIAVPLVLAVDLLLVAACIYFIAG